MMVPDGCMEEAFIQAAGPEANNGKVFLTFGGVLPENQVGKGKEFVDKYKAKYGRMPEAYAIYAYEAANVALERSARPARKIARRLWMPARRSKIIPGALGTWSFDENGDTTLTQMSGSTIKDGKFTFVKLLGEDKEKDKSK